jgi:hypothetical protein
MIRDNVKIDLKNKLNINKYRIFLMKKIQIQFQLTKLVKKIWVK